MTTIRVERRDRFTTIDRDTINDGRLSFKARGVLIWLLDKPDDWRVRSVDIEQFGAEGREAVRSALRELESAGYLERSKSRDHNGKWITESIVRETPAHAADGKPSPGYRQTGSRTSFQRLEPKTKGAAKSTSCVREVRYYDVEPLTPEEVAEKWGVEL